MDRLGQCLGVNGLGMMGNVVCVLCNKSVIPMLELEREKNMCEEDERDP